MKSNVMKRVFTLLLVLCMVSAMLITVSAAPETGSVSMRLRLSRSGNTITATVSMSSQTHGVSDVLFNLNYDNTKVEYVEWSEGSANMIFDCKSDESKVRCIGATENGTYTGTDSLIVVTFAVKDDYLGEVTFSLSGGEAIDLGDTEFTVSDATNTIEVTDAVVGDANGDGIVDSFDSTLILRYDIGMITADQLDLSACDVNGDGVVDSFDSTLVLRFDIGMIDKFPAA